MGMSRLTRDGTAEPVSRDQILRHARGQWNIIFPVQLTTSRIGNLTRLIHTLLYVMTIISLSLSLSPLCHPKGQTMNNVNTRPFLYKTQFEVQYSSSRSQNSPPTME